ncbi:MAG: hydroxymethylbilane synthase, partial [Pseudomonadota bacterium]
LTPAAGLPQMARMTTPINPPPVPLPPKLVIGSRGSPLALAQAEEVRDRLVAAYPPLAESGRVTIETIKTTGDRITDRPLAELGGKELFTKEIEDALLVGRIDIAQHCLKDLPTEQPPGLAVAAMLPREDPRDAFICPSADSIDDLPKGARLGTSSLRRSAFLKAHRPDLQMVDLRGNVGTRLAKIERGEADATILAVAGLKRLGQPERARNPISMDIMLPSPGQGTIALETRSDDEVIQALLAPLACSATTAASDAERALLATLDGSCRTPIAALAEFAKGQLFLRAAIARPDGSEILADHDSGSPSDAAEMGQAVGERLRARAGPGFFG